MGRSMKKLATDDGIAQRIIKDDGKQRIKLWVLKEELKRER